MDSQNPGMNEDLYSYLLKERERRARMNSPEYRQSVNEDILSDHQTMDQNNLGAALMKSAAQIGTLGGKTSDASPVADMARGLNNSMVGFRNSMNQEDEERENRYGMDAKLYEYLDNKKMREAGQEQAAAKDKAAADLAAKRFKSQEDHQRDMRDLAAKGLAMKGEAAKNAGTDIPKYDQVLVTDLSKKNASKISIKNQIKSGLEQFQQATNETDKIRIGNQMIKTLNSTEGADAVGSEESKRLADALEYQMFNFTGPGEMFGRDLPGFESQVQATIRGIEGGIGGNQAEIDRLTAKDSGARAPEPRMTPPPPEGTAIATPGPTESDKKALDYLAKNPSTPEAEGIRQKLRKKGLIK